ncbi:hypothetical protein, partial [Pseudomonas putida]|uniref:hypothetical protein n=1 Tax=Pseudomonas putida TaxID=303 RepID=UPI001E3E916B
KKGSYKAALFHGDSNPDIGLLRKWEKRSHLAPILQHRRGTYVSHCPARPLISRSVSIFDDPSSLCQPLKVEEPR